MGDHYIPRYYLKGFTESESDIIWVYQKDSQSPFKATAANIANINNFYSREVEEHLANDIEEPAKKVFDKIRGLQQIEFEDKETLAKYLMVLWKRVPKQKDWITHKKLPDIMDTILDDVKKDFIRLREERPDRLAIIEKRLLELQDIREHKSDELINDTWLNSILSENTSQSIEAMCNMTWVFFHSQTEDFFICSDNPLFFFPWMGIGKKKSELTFPVTKDIALWATWRIDYKDGYAFCRPYTVKEINRRTITNSYRYLFSPKPADWIPQLTNKKYVRLNRIV